MSTKVAHAPRLASQLVNGLLAIKPLANWAKFQARSMMIKRAATIGIDWPAQVAALRARDWDRELAEITDPQLTYPDYYLRSFHAYDDGNLSWEAATEVEVAAHAVHARIWPDGGSEGDARLRQSYHTALKSLLDQDPVDILDLGCSVGMSTVALRSVFPQARLTGLDLSPYFLAVARHRVDQQAGSVRWIHAAGEATGLDPASFDLVSISLVFHELPQVAARQILQEAHRILRPGGYLAIMDMNPRSEVYAKMPPYLLTLLKSTEPYLDQYFSLDLEQAIVDAGFQAPQLMPNTPRHRTVVAQV